MLYLESTQTFSAWRRGGRETGGPGNVVRIGVMAVLKCARVHDLRGTTDTTADRGGLLFER